MNPAAGKRDLESGLLFGHPRALLFILLCQAGFAFSIAGMESIAVLYMSTYLFQPGHILGIIGFGPLRAALAQMFGASTPAALASVIFGLAGACAYLTPLLGGIISDRFMTRRHAVILGAALCAAGQLLLAAEATFLFGLVILLAGIAFVGVNIATQLGDLYAEAKAELADAFQALHIGVNIAAILGPLVCGSLAQLVAWRWGYVAAAVGMLLGLACYAAGSPWLPAETVLGTRKCLRPQPRQGDRKTVLWLLALLPGLILIGLANGQIQNAYLVWGSTTYRLRAFGHHIPASWLISADAGFSVAASIAVLAFWRAFARRRALPPDLTRIAIGGFICAAAPLVLVLASVQAAETGQRVSLAWAVAFHIVDNIGMAAVGPVAAAMFARCAPRAWAGLMMGALNADGFGGALAVGFLGTLLGHMSASHFWTLQAGLVALGAITLVAIRLASGSALRRADAVGSESAA
jgi:POT family proton-dependent oligopeptide transporter